MVDDLSLVPSQSLARPKCPVFADVILPRHLNRSFTYTIPSRLQERLFVGGRVLVPFGSTRLQGIVVSVFADLHGETRTHSFKKGLLTTARLRDVIDLLDEGPESRLPADLIMLSRIISERYLAPWGQCLRLILPSTPLRKNSRYLLTDSGRALLGSPDHANRLSPSSGVVLSRLAQSSKGLSIATLRHAIPGPFKPVLLSLKRRQLVKEVNEGTEAVRIQEKPRRLSLNDITVTLQQPIPGSPTPQLGELPASEDIRHIHAAIEGRKPACILIQTSIHHRLDYLTHAVEEAFACQRTALIITPEIARAEALIAHFISQWGEQAALLHSGLSTPLRASLWSRIRRGRIRLVVGTRSAVFSPLPSLGLICLEDEHDSSLKEESEPRYHAREVASIRAQQHGATLLLLSAHPSLETVHTCDNNAEASGRTRVDENPLRRPIVLKPFATAPVVQVVDLRRQPYDTFLSEAMLAGIQSALDARAGVILFLNRKGYSSALLCRECGLSPQCPTCSISLTFYKEASRLTCHYCGTSLPPPDACPSCFSTKLEPVGSGTERVEAAIRRYFPNEKIGRLDREVTPSQAKATRRQVLSGQIDILIGTQMLLQGQPLPPVGFVGLIHADAGMHLPDFRASERAFHTLMDAVAMARPRESGGNVVLQTYLPTHHVIAAVTNHSPSIFYDQELNFRRMLAYPPFGHIINLRITGTRKDRVRDAAERWAKQLRAAAVTAGASLTQDVHTRIDGSDADRQRLSEKGHEVTILGPVPFAVSQIRGRYRWQILVKSSCAETARTTVHTTLDDIEKVHGRSGLKYEVDVDPVTMM